MLLSLIAFMNPAEPGLYYFPNFYLLLPEVRAYGVNNWLSLSLYNEYINATLTDEDKARLLSEIDGSGYFLWGFGSGEVMLNYRGFYGGLNLVSGAYLGTATTDPVKLLLYGNDGESVYDLSLRDFEATGYYSAFLGLAPRYGDFVFGFRAGYVGMMPYLKVNRGFIQFEDRATQQDNNAWIIRDTLSITFAPGGSGFTSSFGLLYEPMGKGWYVGFSLENILSIVNLTNRTTFPFVDGAMGYDTLVLYSGYYTDQDSQFVATDSAFLVLSPEHAFDLYLSGETNISFLRAAIQNGDTITTTTASVEYFTSKSYRLPLVLRLDFGYRDITDRYGFRFQYIQGFSESFYATRTPKVVAFGMYKPVSFLPLGLKMGFGGREKFEFGLFGGLDFKYWFLNLNWNWSRGLFSSAKGHRLIASMGFKSPITGKFQVKVIDSITGEPLIARVKVERGEKTVSTFETSEGGVGSVILSPDRYAYTVEKEGYIPVTDTLTLLPKVLTSRTVSLVPAGGFINIVVLDSITGDTLSGAKVVVGDSSFIYPGGVLKVFARAGDVRISAYMDKYRDHASVLTVEAGKEYPYVIRMAPATAQLIVKVVDSRKRSPLVASIRVLTAEGEALMDTSASAVTVELPEAGAYKLMVSRKGYYDYSEVIPVKAGMTIRKEVALRKVEPEAGTLIVKVIDATTGDAIAGANVLAISGKGDTVFTLTTGEKGSVKSRLLKGSYRIVVSALDYLPAERNISIGKNQTVDITIPLKSKYAIVFGYVLDHEKGTRVKADIRVYDADGNLVKSMKADSYYVKLPAGKYTFKVSAKKYIERVADVSLEPAEKYRKDFLLLKEKQVLTFRNIYFDFNKATIRPESYPVLDSIAQLLKENPSIIVEVAGHTDERGSYEYNMKLSQARAEAVVNYLIRKGIDPRRLIPRGYGESQPIIPNAKTEAEHQMNRRVEFRIIGELNQEEGG